ncbi:MAG TPA: T9SS type A sorting domain-containing protein, partial [Chitinophagaceae bacterium]|nr:T9SS type A sorting domain-containing protein [Chitinophagaceae bacterium]
LRDWFQLTDADLQSVFINASFTSLPIFNQLALPVSILSFTGNWKNAEVSLQWTTDKETNIDSYEIQRSEDGVNFSKKGTVTALNVASKHDYTWYDNSLSQAYYYYRIKIVEKSGTIKYSTVLLLKDTQQVKGVRVKILPNPIDNWFVTSFQDKITGSISVRMLDMSGKEVWKGEQHANDVYNLTFTIDKHIMPGVYVIQVRDSSNYEASSKVLLR